ncbi:MAG: hypothetical protein INF91_00335, partial [Alphaproteobacteria bacterium]|nr:hypothetical protein [Alphaproteobacteria bacterium]
VNALRSELEAERAAKERAIDELSAAHARDRETLVQHVQAMRLQLESAA